MLEERLEFLKGVEVKKKLMQKKNNFLYNLAKGSSSLHKMKGKEEFRGFIKKSRADYEASKDRSESIGEGTMDPEFFLRNGFKTSKYVQLTRMKLKKIDESFENCFSNVFKSENQKRFDLKKLKGGVRKPRNIPYGAKKDSLRMSIRCLKSLQMSRSQRTDSYKQKRKQKISVMKLIQKKQTEFYKEPNYKDKFKFKSSSTPIKKIEPSSSLKKTNHKFRSGLSSVELKNKEMNDYLNKREKYKRMKKAGLIVKSCRKKRDSRTRRPKVGSMAFNQRLFIRKQSARNGYKHRRFYGSLGDYANILPEDGL